MAIDPETDALIRDLAIALIVRLIQIVTGILSLVGLAVGKYPESILGLLFVLAMGGTIPRQKGN